MKATDLQKNVAGLSAVLLKMSRRMVLANYAERTISSYSRAVRLMGVNLRHCSG